MEKETKKTKFTKGPWNVTKKSWDKPYKVYGGAAGKTLVATMPTHEGCQCIEDEGNVRLIAAAPELYESLDLLLSIVIKEGWSETMIKNAESVLAKVRGEVKE